MIDVEGQREERQSDDNPDVDFDSSSDDDDYDGGTEYDTASTLCDRDSQDGGEHEVGASTLYDEAVAYANSAPDSAASTLDEITCLTTPHYQPLNVEDAVKHFLLDHSNCVNLAGRRWVIVYAANRVWKALKRARQVCHDSDTPIRPFGRDARLIDGVFFAAAYHCLLDECERALSQGTWEHTFKFVLWAVNATALVVLTTRAIIHHLATKKNEIDKFLNGVAPHRFLTTQADSLRGVRFLVNSKSEIGKMFLSESHFVCEDDGSTLVVGDETFINIKGRWVCALYTVLKVQDRAREKYPNLVPTTPPSPQSPLPHRQEELFRTADLLRLRSPVAAPGPVPASAPCFSPLTAALQSTGTLSEGAHIGATPTLASSRLGTLYVEPDASGT